MGRDRILVNWLNEVHDRFRTPYRSIAATGIITLVLIAIGVGIGTLAEVASFMYLVTYALVHVAVVVLRRADPDGYDPSFRIPTVLYPVVPALGLIACLAILVQMNWIVQVTGVVIVGLGSLWYGVYARDRATSVSLVGEAIAPRPTPVADGQGTYRVVVPVANPQTEQDLLRMAAASAHAHDDEAAELIAVNVIEVPQQTSLSQDLSFEEERVERQRELLDAAREIARGLDVGLRTRAIVGRNAGSVILDVIEEEDADHVLLGWKGSRSRRDHLLGSTIDPVVSRAPCEATLVTLGPAGTRGEGDILVLAGEGPHAPIAAKRAAELVAATRGEASLTLYNVQRPSEADESDDGSPAERGAELIDDLAKRAGIQYMEFEQRVAVTDDVERQILDTADEYDTVCVGATRSGAISRALFGSLPESIGEKAKGTVVMARGPEESAMSIREALVRRLEM